MEQMLVMYKSLLSISDTKKEKKYLSWLLLFKQKSWKGIKREDMAEGPEGTAFMAALNSGQWGAYEDHD